MHIREGIVWKNINLKNRKKTAVIQKLYKSYTKVIQKLYKSYTEPEITKFEKKKK